MIPCPTCRHHVRLGPQHGRCAFCGALVEARRFGAVAVLLGLGLQGCEPTSVPLYGAPVTDVSEETGDTGDTTTE